MTRRLLTFVIAACLLGLSAVPAVAAPFAFPVVDQDGFPINSEPPSVTAASWIIYDASSDMVLAEWDADTSRPMASVTKIMTVMLALENGDPSDEVVVSEVAAGQGGQEINLVAGETVTLGALTRAAMVRSGNDAAAAIAEHIGGSIEGFAQMMNERAQELGMTNTHYVNPHGLDTAGHYSSARDLLILAKQAMSMPEFEELARSRMMVFPDSPNGSQRTASNTNRILNSYDGAIGVKTGETPNAGLTYVGAAERDGRRLYVVVLRSVGRRAHFADAIELYDWAFQDLSIHGLLTAGIPYLPVTDRVDTPLVLEEARIDTYLEMAAQSVGSESPPLEVSADDAIPVAEGPLELSRSPEPAPDSLLSTISYWFGLVTGAWDG